MDERPILIAGAGIGGLTATLALQRAGFPVRVFEAAPALGEVGAGLTLAANGSRVIQVLGLGEVLERHAVVPARGAVLDYRDGHELVDIPRGAATTHRGAPYCQIHRADLHRALADAVLANDPGCIALDRRVAGIVHHDGGVTVELGDGSTASGRALIGCDGIRSTIRAALFGAESPRFTGYVAWRGLIPMDRLPPGMIQPESAVWQGPGHFLTRYRIRGGTLLNYVAIARSERWTDEGWSVPSTVDEVLAEFADFNVTARTMLAATPPDRLFKWGIFDREPLGHWTVGRISLLGDAAHAMTPFLGQGAVMALEDALVLARAFEAARSVPEALARYEAARRERTTAVFLASRENGQRLTSFDPDRYRSGQVFTNEESLGLADYDAATVPV